MSRSPSSSLGEEHHWQPKLSSEFEQSVLLAMVVPALGTRQHGVVVAHGHDRTASHCADATHHAVGRSVRDQVVERAATALRSEHQRPVLHEGTRVEQVGDVLACGPPTALATSRHGLRSSCVETRLVAAEHLEEVVAN